MNTNTAPTAPLVARLGYTLVCLFLYFSGLGNRWGTLNLPRVFHADVEKLLLPFVFEEVEKDFELYLYGDEGWFKGRGIVGRFRVQMTHQEGGVVFSCRDVWDFNPGSFSLQKWKGLMIFVHFLEKWTKVGELVRADRGDSVSINESLLGSLNPTHEFTHAWEVEYSSQELENLKDRFLHLLGTGGFKGSNLSGANLSGVNLSGVNLSGADLTKVNLSGADLTEANLKGAYLNGAKLDGANLSGANLTKATLTGANLNGAKLDGANLSGANLWVVDFSGVNLPRVDLSGANLNGAILSGVDLTGANLSEANLNGSNLNGANLRGANLRGAALNEADLIGANLNEADLQRANLWEANLSGANLSGANLVGANLEGALLPY
jgi:uncharacterized protein YjbI with pentapeptide repeats